MASNALLKALEVLETVSRSDNALTVKDISEVGRDSQSSVQRSVYTLEALGYLEREDSGKRYVPGRACLRPVYGYLRNNRFLETATPYLIDLSERFSTRADLTVLDGTEIVYLSRIPSRDELLHLSPLGRRWPAVQTASGRAILAAMTEQACNQVIEGSKLEQITPHSLCTQDAIFQAIQETRQLGYAFQSEEVLLGAASVGAAVVGANRVVQGAIILGGPVEAFADQEHRHQLGNALKLAAQAIGTHIS